MRISLKGLNAVKARLANGTECTYYYAWKGGPRIPGAPGSPEFMFAYNEAVSKKRQPKAGTLQSVLDGFQASGEWDELALRTRQDYAKLIKAIEADFGTFPISGLSDRRSRGIFLEWRDKRAKNSKRQADYGMQVLARILAWAYGRGLVPANPCEKLGRLYKGNRVEHIWSAEQEAALYASDQRHLHLALTLALWTGQREGDLLAMTWSQYDGSTIRLTQSKTKTRVLIPVGRPLREALDRARKPVGHMLLNSFGEPWTPDGFRSSWSKAVRKAGIFGVTFNDLRGTAITRLALAQCTEAEIATISGHTLTEVRSILDKHYLHRDPELARSAVKKLEARTKFPK